MRLECSGLVFEVYSTGCNRRIINRRPKSQQPSKNEIMSNIDDELSSAEEFRRSSHILKGLRIKGEITGQEDLRIDGMAAPRASFSADS